VPAVNDPVLLSLIADGAALLMLGALLSVVRFAVQAWVLAGLAAAGLLLCLPPLLLQPPSSVLAVPIGPPGLALYFTLDSLSVFSLILCLLAGTLIATFQAISAQPPELLRITAICLGATIITLVSADGTSLTLGLTAVCAATGYGRRSTFMLLPIAVLAAVALLTPAGYAPRFDAIRAAPIDTDRAAAAATLAVAGVVALLWQAKPQRCWTRDALSAGILLPTALYLLLRLAVDLPGSATQFWWGAMLVLAGGTAAMTEGWRAASAQDIDTAVAALLRDLAAVAVVAIGLAMIARAADLPGSATFAYEAACLAALTASLAGTLAVLSCHVIGTNAGTYRLFRLGGLAQSMPATAAALAAGLFSLAMLPPGLGFAVLWLSFQAILAAPRTGGLLAQFPLAWAAAAVAVAAALTSVATLRIAGIALLGRPRTPRGAGAVETSPTIRTVLASLGAVCMLVGILPGPLLRILGGPLIAALTGLPATRGLGFLATPSATAAYLPLPVLALIAACVGVPLLVMRRTAGKTKISGPWIEGMPPPEALPFGNPAAQSIGAGFLPALPAISRPAWPRLRLPHRLPVPSAAAGIWLVVGGFAALLLALMVTS
jgi:hydrogenase-4 component B